MGRLLVLLVCVAPLVAAPVPKALKGKSTLHGLWEVVERRNDDKPLTKTGREIWVIDENGYAIYDGLKEVADILDPAVKPYRAKWRHTGEDPSAFDTFGGSDNVGKAELDGDTLRIGFDIHDRKVKVRPAEAKPGVGVAYIHFKRVDDPRPQAK